MIAEDLEFSISQYVDGTLSPDERAAVEAALAVDPDARTALAEHRKLNQLLSSAPTGLDWDWLANHLSVFAVNGGDDHVAVAGRIGWRSPWRIGSIAAAAVVAVTVAMLAHRGPSGATVVPSVDEGQSIAVVTGPSVESAAGPAEADVKIGPSPALAAKGESGRYAEGVVERRSNAVIAAAAEKLPKRGERYH